MSEEEAKFEVDIPRCKDCVFFRSPGACGRHPGGNSTMSDHYCGDGFWIDPTTGRPELTFWDALRTEPASREDW